MYLNDEQMISEIRAGGSRQEYAIKRLYEHCFGIAREGRIKFSKLDEDDLISAYDNAIIAIRKQILNNVLPDGISLLNCLQQIFYNRCIDIFRSKSSNPVQLMGEVPDTTDESQDLLSRWADEEQVEKLKHKLLQLGKVCQQILMYSEYLGYDALEIANAIELKNVNSIENKKYACLQKLRELMGVQ